MSTMLISDGTLVMLHTFLTKAQRATTKTIDTPLGIQHALNRHGFTPYTFSLACIKYNWIATDHSNGKRTWTGVIENMFKNLLQRQEKETGVYQAYKSVQFLEYNIPDIEGNEHLDWLDARELEEYFKLLKCLERLERLLSEHIISFLDGYNRAVWG